MTPIKSVITVRRNGRTYGIFVNGFMIEGGFFTRHGAVAVAKTDYGYQGD